MSARGERAGFRKASELPPCSPADSGRVSGWKIHCKTSLPGCGYRNHAANRVQEFATSIGLAKITDTLASHCCRTCPGVVMSGDKENWRCNALGGQLVSQINPGHAGQLDVEDKANESRLLLIPAERFGGSVSDRLHPCRAQQSSDRAPQTFVIVDDTYIEIAYAANRHGDKITGHTALALLPFREADSCPGLKSDRRSQAHAPFSGRSSREVAKQHILDRRQVFRGGR